MLGERLELKQMNFVPKADLLQRGQSLLSEGARETVFQPSQGTENWVY